VAEADRTVAHLVRRHLAQSGNALTDAQWDGLACAVCGRPAEECGPMLGMDFGERTLFLCEDFAACLAVKGGRA
jgi:hypothetical protein